MDLDANVLINELGRQIGALSVELTAARLRLDLAESELTALRSAPAVDTPAP